MKQEIQIDLTEDGIEVEKWTNALHEVCVSITDGDITIKLLRTKDKMIVFNDQRID